MPRPALPRLPLPRPFLSPLPLLTPLLALGLSACSPSLQSGILPNLGDIIAARSASASLLTPDGNSGGTATFAAQQGGARVTLQVSGLKPGLHAMHIHEFGNCTDTRDAQGRVTVFGGAGDHFDPYFTHRHGGPDDDDRRSHAGDLPMLVVGADGTGRADFYTDKISLSGETGVLRRALVVHALPDDYRSNPSGGSGARERCGVIAPPTSTP